MIKVALVASAVFLFFSAIFWIPAIFTLRMSLPPFGYLARSDGVLEFEKMSPRSGTMTVLLRSDGSIQRFSCSFKDGQRHDCLSAEYGGQQASIWWFPLSLSPWTEVNAVARIDVNNKEVVSYEDRIKSLDSQKTMAVSLSVILLLLFLGWVLFYFRREARKT